MCSAYTILILWASNWWRWYRNKLPTALDSICLMCAIALHILNGKIIWTGPARWQITLPSSSPFEIAWLTVMSSKVAQSFSNERTTEVDSIDLIVETWLSSVLVIVPFRRVSHQQHHTHNRPPAKPLHFTIHFIEPSHNEVSWQIKYGHKPTVHTSAAKLLLLGKHNIEKERTDNRITCSTNDREWYRI